MERQNRLLTVLAGILLLLVTVVVLSQDREGGADDPDAPPSRDLFAYDAGDITRLVVRPPGAEVVLEKRDGTWTMTAPREAPVEERRVSEIVERLADLEVEERALAGEPAGYGLDEASRVELRLEKADGTAYALFVGKDAPVGYRTYVQESADGPARLASTRIGDLAHRTADDFRAKDLWRFSPSGARRIRIDDGGRAVVLRKDDHGWWLGDDGPRADADAVEDWLSDASLLRASTFLDDVDPATVGLAAPGATITVEDDGGTHTVRYGQRDDAGVVAQGMADPVRVGPEALGLLKLDGWTGTALVPVRRHQVDRLEVTLGERSATFTRQDGVWRDAGGGETEAPEAVLDAIEAVKADRTVAGLPAPSEVWGRIVLAEGESRTETVVFGSPVAGGGARVAKDHAGGPAFTVEQAGLDAVAATLP